MVEKINLPIKISGDTLSAIEFNQVVDKTNSLITEFNSATTLSQVTWTVGQPKPTIVADEIIGTISEGETKYVQTSTVGNQTIAILHSPNSVLTSFTQELHNIEPALHMSYPLVGSYFIDRNTTTWLYELKHVSVDGVISTITLGNETNTGRAVSDDHTNLGVLTTDYLIIVEGNYVDVIDRETNTWNETLSVKATELIGNAVWQITSDGLHLYALVNTSDNEFATSHDVKILTLDLEFNLLSTRTIATHVVPRGTQVLKCKYIAVIDNMLYEVWTLYYTTEHKLLVKRYNLETSAYDDTWGNVEILRPGLDFGGILNVINTTSCKCIKSGTDIYLFSTYFEIQGSAHYYTLKLNSAGSEFDIISFPALSFTDFDNYSLFSSISFLSNNKVAITTLYSSPTEPLKQEMHLFTNGVFIDVSEDFAYAEIAANGIMELDNDKLAVFGCALTAVDALNFYDLRSDRFVITDLSLNPKQNVYSSTDYYAKILNAETGSSIKSKLETLTDDNRLDSSAIKNLPVETTDTIKSKLESLHDNNRLPVTAIDGVTKTVISDTTVPTSNRHVLIGSKRSNSVGVYEVNNSIVRTDNFGKFTKYGITCDDTVMSYANVNNQQFVGGDGWLKCYSGNGVENALFASNVPAFSSEPVSIYVQYVEYGDSQLYVVCGTTIKKLSTAGIEDTTFAANLPVFNSSIKTLCITSTGILVGGSFTGGAFNYLTKLNFDGTEDMSYMDQVFMLYAGSAVTVIKQAYTEFGMATYIGGNTFLQSVSPNGSGGFITKTFDDLGGTITGIEFNYEWDIATQTEKHVMYVFGSKLNKFVDGVMDAEFGLNAKNGFRTSNLCSYCGNLYAYQYIISPASHSIHKLSYSGVYDNDFYMPIDEKAYVIAPGPSGGLVIGGNFTGKIFEIDRFTGLKYGSYQKYAGNPGDILIVDAVGDAEILQSPTVPSTLKHSGVQGSLPFWEANA